MAKSRSMQPTGRGNLIKLWLYAIVVVVGGAWITPAVYQGGKALAEVTSSRPTNGLLAWLGELSQRHGFAWFYQAAMWLVAASLFFPWLEWLHGHADDEETAADKATATPSVPRTCQGLVQLAGGFLLVPGIWLTMAMALVQMHALTLRPAGLHPGEFLLVSAVAALALAVLLECLFRGIALGVFLRAMRPALAVCLSSVLFALVMAIAVPPPGVNVADPEAAGGGMALMVLACRELLDPHQLMAWFVPWFVLGLMLGRARLRSGRLWLSVGMHAGWIFALTMQSRWFAHAANQVAVIRPHGWLAMVTIAIVCAGLLLNSLIRSADHV